MASHLQHLGFTYKLSLSQARSGDARTQPLYFLITTAGTDTNSICYEVHQKALDIIEGRKIDPTFYPVIYGAEESDD